MGPKKNEEETFSFFLNARNLVLRTKVLTRIMEEFNLEIPAYILESLSRKMSDNSLAIEKYNKGKYYIERLSSMDDIEKAVHITKKLRSVIMNIVGLEKEKNPNFGGNVPFASNVLVACPSPCVVEYYAIQLVPVTMRGR